MVEITETDDSKVNSHHRYTGAVRIEFPRGEETVDVDEETARTAVNTYETVEFADELVEQHEAGSAEAEAGKKSDTRTHRDAAGDDSDVDATSDGRESRAPNAEANEEDDDERDEPGHEAP